MDDEAQVRRRFYLRERPLEARGKSSSGCRDFEGTLLNGMKCVK